MLHLYMIQTIFGVRTRLCKLQKGCTPLAAASAKVYQLLAHGRWFSPGTPASSTNAIAESGVKHQKIKSIKSDYMCVILYEFDLDRRSIPR